MVSSRSRQNVKELFSGLLLGLVVSLSNGQTLTRIAESSVGAADFNADYTGQIRQFSEIGPSGVGTTPRPWVCYTDFNPVANPIAVVQWQTHDGSAVPMIPSGFTQATGSELYQVTTGGGPALIRGPDYNSPDGEYCCVIPTDPGQRRCVTLTTCPMLPFPANGSITYDPDTNVATYSCDQPEYAPTIPQRTCQSDNQWSGMTVICSTVMCPTLSNPANGQVTVSTHTVGSVATYTCNNGYNLTGANMTMCVKNGVLGKWSPKEPTCQPFDCGPLNNPTNGQVMVSTTTFNNMATYSCNSSYTLNGTQTRTCQASGVWSNAEPTCETLCSRFTLSNGMVTYSLSKDPPPVGTVATYSCDTGYDLTGNRMRICEEESGWTGSLPVCNIVDCGALTHTLNGQVNTSSGTTYNQVATYSCDTGYNLIGPSTRTCQANGKWSSTAPVCEFIRLSFQAVVNTNNSVVSISHIGEGASALTCHTELTTCCREQDNPSGGALGEWIGPDSNQIPESNSTSGFYVTRQQSSINLNRGGHSTVGGQYCCVIPRTGGEMTFCVQVLKNGSETSTNENGPIDLIVVFYIVIAVILAVFLTITITLVMILIISRKRIRTQQLGQHLPSEKQVYEPPDRVLYEDTCQIGMARTGDHTYTPAVGIELIYCQAGVPPKVFTGGEEEDMSDQEQNIYDN